MVCVLGLGSLVLVYSFQELNYRIEWTPEVGELRSELKSAFVKWNLRLENSEYAEAEA